MDEALIDQNLSFRAFRSARERFLVERAAEAALVRSAKRAHESQHHPSPNSPQARTTGGGAPSPGSMRMDGCSPSGFARRPANVSLLTRDAPLRLGNDGQWR